MTRAMKTATRAGASGLLFFLAIGLLWAGFMISQRPMAMADPEPTPVTPVQVAAALSRVGVSPLTLAAAGVSGQSAALMVADVGEYLGSNQGAPGDQDAALGAARANRDRLHSMARAGTASSQDIEALPSADTAYAQADAALAASLGAIWDLAAARMTIDQAAVVARLHAVPAVFRGSMIPIEFGAVDRSEADWLALREALAAERYAAEYEESLDQSQATVLSDARAESGVILATSNIATLLAGVQSSWDQALSAFE